MRKTLMPALVAGLLIAACGDDTATGGSGGSGGDNPGGSNTGGGGNPSTGGGGNPSTGGGGNPSTGGNGGENVGGTGGTGGQGGGTPDPVCGNGAIETGETCDDSNTANLDGCSSVCAIEDGYACANEPSVCTATCGDGNIAAGAEDCDDGNTVAGDGCAAACTIELGWSCMNEPSVCMTGCGDGIIAGSEECDDSGVVAGDGCDAACAVESGYSCNGEPSVCALAGSCADPILVTGDGFVWTAANLTPFGDDLDNADASCTANNLSALDHPDVVFQVDLAAGETLHIAESGAADVLFHVLTGACDSATACAASFDGIGASEITPGLVYQATAAETVFVVIDSYNTPPVTDDVDLLFEISPCGDGLVGSGEGCDDSNAASGDGCSATCGQEPGYVCVGEPSVCTLLQGTTCANPITANDGFTYVGANIGSYGDDLDFTDPSCFNVSGTPNESPEMVFQIALNAGQRLNVTNFGTEDVVWQVVPTCAVGVCSANFDGNPGSSEQTIGLNYQAPTTGTYFVVVESYFAGPSLDPTDTFDVRFAVATCGDGTVELGEPCDDGNLNPNDGCSPTCVVEAGFSCAGSPSVCTGVPLANCASPIIVNSNSFTYAGANIGSYGDTENYNAGATCVDVSTTPPSGHDLVFRVDAAAGESIRVRELAALDSVIHVLTQGQCAAGVACVASSDGAEATGLTYVAPAAGPIFIVVESWGNGTGQAFDVRIDRSLCGDAVVGGTESCDDGNLVNGDGCSSTCNVEANFACNGAGPGNCFSIAGCTTATCFLGPCAGTVVTGVASAGLPLSVPDNLPAGASVVLNIPQTGTIQRMAMSIDATQTFDGDFDFLLSHGAVTDLDVCTDNGGNGDNFVDTFIRDGVTNSVTTGTAPFTGVFRPEAAFSAFNGQSVSGNWTLRVVDDASGDTGSLTSWDVAFCVTP